MTELVRIATSGQDRVETAQKLLKAADDPADVRTVTGGFVVSKGLAQKAGVLETSGPADGFATNLAAGTTEAETGFTTSTENGPSPEGKESDASVSAEASASPADGGEPASTEAQADDAQPAEEKADATADATKADTSAKRGSSKG